MLGYVKAYSPEQTILTADSTLERSVISCVVYPHKYVHTHTEKHHSHTCFKAHSHKQTQNQIGNATSWSLVLPDYHVIAR